MHYSTTRWMLVFGIMRRMRWVDELCVRLCNCQSAGPVCLPWLPHVREHSVHGVQSERMQLMGQSTTQLSDSVHLLTRPSCRESSSLVRTGCRLAWLKQLALAFRVFREWIRSDQVVLVSASPGTKLKPVCQTDQRTMGNGRTFSLKELENWCSISVKGWSRDLPCGTPRFLAVFCICYLLTLPRLHNLSIAANAVEETQAETFPTHGVLTQLACAPVYNTHTHTG